MYEEYGPSRPLPPNPEDVPAGDRSLHLIDVSSLPAKRIRQKKLSGREHVVDKTSTSTFPLLFGPDQVVARHDNTPDTLSGFFYRGGMFRDPNGTPRAPPWRGCSEKKDPFDLGSSSVLEGIPEDWLSGEDRGFQGREGGEENSIQKGNPAETINQGLTLCSELGLVIESNIYRQAGFYDRDRVLLDFPSQTSLGIKLGGCQIKNCLIGGPAYLSRKLDPGDIITGIDGKEVTESNIGKAVMGDDVLGSSVVLEVRKQSGRMEHVLLRRASSIVLADKRKMSELLQSLRASVMRSLDSAMLREVEDFEMLWTNVMLAEADQAEAVFMSWKGMRLQAAQHLFALQKVIQHIDPRLVSLYQSRSIVETALDRSMEVFLAREEELKKEVEQLRQKLSSTAANDEEKNMQSLKYETSMQMKVILALKEKEKSLMDEHTFMQEEIQALQDQLRNVSLERDRLWDKVESINKENDRKDRERAQQTAIDLVAADNEISWLRQMLEEERANLAKQIDNSRAAMDELNMKLETQQAEHSRSIFTANCETADLQTKIAQVTAKLDAKTASETKLSKELIDLNRKESEEMKWKCVMLEKALTESETERKEAQARAEEEADQMAVIADNLRRTMEEQLSDLREEHQRVELERDGAVERIRDHEKQSAALDAESKELREALMLLRAERDQFELAAAKVAAGTPIAESNRSNSEEAKTVLHLETKIAKVTAKLDAKTASETKLSKELIDLKLKCEALGKENAKWHREHEEALLQIAELDAESKELREALASLRAKRYHAAPAAEAKAAAENAPAQLIMTLGLDFNMAGSEGSDNREKSKRNVTQDLANASGLPPANFRIKDVSPGSIILDTEVTPDPLAPGKHLLAVKDLAEQVLYPSSKLRSGRITSHATGVEVIPAKAISGNDEDLRETVTQKEKILDRQHQNIASLEEELSELRRQKNIQEQKIASLETEFKDQLRNVSLERDRLWDKVESINKENDRKDRERAQQTAIDLVAADNEISLLRQMLEEERANLAKQIDNSRAAMDELNMKLETQQAEHSRSIFTANCETADLQTKFDAKDQELNAKDTQFKEASALLVLGLTELEEQRDTLLADLDVLALRNQDLEEKIAASDAVDAATFGVQCSIAIEHLEAQLNVILDHVQILLDKELFHKACMLEYRHNSDGEVSRLEVERDSLLEERQTLIELVEREKSKYMAENTRLRSQIALFKSEKEADILTRRALTADIISNVSDVTADVDSMVEEIKHLHEEIKRLQVKCEIPKQQQEVLRFTGELSVSKDKIAGARKVIHF